MSDPDHSPSSGSGRTRASRKVAGSGAPGPAALRSRKARSRSSQPLWTRNFVCGTLVNFTLSTNYFMLMVVMTAYALNVYAAPPALAALCASAFIIGTLVSRFISAPLMGLVGRKPLLLVSAIVEVGLTALYLVDEPVGALVGLRFVHGMAYGVCSTTIATMVTAGIPAMRKGEGVGYFMLSSTLGSAIGPFAGILMANHLGYPVLFIVSCAVVALGVPFILALRPAAPSRRKEGMRQAALEEASAADAEAAAEIGPSAEGARELAAAAGDARAARGVASSGDAPSAHGPKRRRRTAGRTASPAGAGGWLHKAVEPKVLPISAVCGLVFFGYSSLLTFLTPYAAEIGLSRAASVFFVAYALAMFVTRPFTGRAFDRKGPAIVMGPAFFTFAAGMLLVAFSSNDWMILGAALLLGYGVGTVQSCGLAMAVNIADDSRLSVANATFYMLLDAGVGVGPLLLGLIVPVIGYQWLYCCMAGVGLLAFAAFVVVLRKPTDTEAR